jgi:hypothetical protein
VRSASWQIAAVYCERASGRKETRPEVKWSNNLAENSMRGVTLGLRTGSMWEA